MLINSMILWKCNYFYEYPANDNIPQHMQMKPICDDISNVLVIKDDTHLTYTSVAHEEVSLIS